jgi:hypothetical protein
MRIMASKVKISIDKVIFDHPRLLFTIQGYFLPFKMKKLKIILKSGKGVILQLPG